MNFLLDESVEARIAVFLSAKGYDAKRIGTDYPPGLTDDQVLEIARSEQRILITNDRDFGELVFRKKLPHTGVIYFRFPLDATASQKIKSLKKLLTTHRDYLHEFLVVTPAKVRIGKLKRNDRSN